MHRHASRHRLFCDICTFGGRIPRQFRDMKTTKPGLRPGVGAGVCTGLHLAACSAVFGCAMASSLIRSRAWRIVPRALSSTAASK